MKKEGRSKSPRTDLEESLKGLDEVGRSDFWTAREGKNTIRIVPWRKVFYFKAILHYGFKRTGGGKRDMAYPCLLMDEEAKSCPICDYHEKLSKSSDEDKAKLAQRIRPVTKYYVNLFDRDRHQDGIRMFGFSGKMMRTLRGYLEDEDYGDITDPEEGRDVILTREGTGFTTTTYEIRVRAKSSPIDYKGWEEEIHELDKEVVTQKVDKEFLEKQVDDLKKILSGGEDEEEVEGPKHKKSKKEDEEEEESEEEEEEESEEEEEEEEEEKPSKKSKKK